MKKIFVLLVGLALFAMNVFAAVNVNTATQSQLETLNGIGPAKAKAIIDYRTKNGPFKTVEELDKVSGIGPGVLGKIKAEAAVSGETTVKAADKKAAKEEKKAEKADKKANKEEMKAEKVADKAEKKADKVADNEEKKAEKVADKAAKKAEKKAAKEAAKEEKKADKK